jgi:hypothetical protein
LLRERRSQMIDKGDGQLALPVSVCYMNSAPASPPCLKASRLQAISYRAPEEYAVVAEMVDAQR